MTAKEYDDEDLAVSYQDGWAAGQRDQRKGWVEIVAAITSALTDEQRASLLAVLKDRQQKEYDNSKVYATMLEPMRAMLHLDKAQVLSAAIALIEEV